MTIINISGSSNNSINTGSLFKGTMNIVGDTMNLHLEDGGYLRGMVWNGVKLPDMEGPLDMSLSVSELVKPKTPVRLRRWGLNAGEILWASAVLLYLFVMIRSCP